MSPSPQTIATPAKDFLVGQDPDGHWLALEAGGLRGGIFRDERAALRYARDESLNRPGAVSMSPSPLALLPPRHSEAA